MNASTIKPLPKLALPKKARVVTALTLIPTIFALIAVVLINVGGVSSDVSTTSLSTRREMNGMFDLVHFNYDLTPRNSTRTITNYSFRIFLNRACYTGSGTEDAETANPVSYSNTYCNTGRHVVLESADLPAGSQFMQALNPINFPGIPLAAPFAFYVVAGIASFFLLLLTAFSFGTRRARRQTTCVVLAWITWLSLLIASTVLTNLMIRTRNSVRDNTSTVVSGNTSPSTLFPRPMTADVVLNSVSLGRVVMGLTWAALAAMWVSATLWTYVAVEVSRLAKRQGVEVEKEAVAGSQPADFQ